MATAPTLLESKNEDDRTETDRWRCRFQHPSNGKAVSHAAVLRLLNNLAAGDLDFIKTEHLSTFDGKPGYSLGQGQ